MTSSSTTPMFSPGRSVFRLFIFGALWLMPLVGQSHMLNMTRIEVDLKQDGTGEATVTIDLGQSLMSAAEYWQATQAPLSEQRALLARPIAQLSNSISYAIDSQSVTPELINFQISATSLEAIQNPLTPQMAVFRYQFRYPSGSNFTAKLSDNLEVPWPCLLRVDVEGQALPASRLLTEGDRLSLPVALQQAEQGIAADLKTRIVNSWAGIAPEMTWIAVGFQHIFPEGLDHMLFILGLFFLAGGWRTLLMQVTAFTVAHSLTLGLTMYGVISLPVEIIEPLIALSIVYVAVDNLFSTKLARWRLLVVCLFGLLHGMGFASVLADIGLPESQFLLALGLFNLGVELGQLSVLLCAFLIVGWFQRQTWYQSFIAHPATVAIAGTGAYWFLKRIAF